jgi:hypothetical protein
MRVALSFLRARRGKRLVWIEYFLDLLHILLELLVGFSFLMQPRLDGMVRVTHAKQEPEHLLNGRGRLFTPLSRRLPLISLNGLTRFCCCGLLLRCGISSWRGGDLSWRD